MGSRVCNQGKTQRLVIGVLQGRLNGVDIELIPDMRVSTAQAVAMFFNIEANKGIRKLQPLVEAANHFCDQNPAVNREEFILEINKYAETEFED